MHNSDMTQLTHLQQALAGQGLNLFALIPVQQLPGHIWLDNPTSTRGSLLLLGHGGRRFWEVFKQSKQQSNDPVDRFSAETSEQLLQNHLPSVDRLCLFPEGDCPVNLMALGQSIGLHAPSPLGMGIHAEFGVWSAYRALWWLAIEATIGVTTATTTCAHCTTQDCVRHCPAQALAHGEMPDLNACGRHRLREGSSCETACLARSACPVAAEHRYTPEQMAYHYDLARSRLGEYVYD